MTLYGGGAALNMANGVREFAQSCPDRAAVVDGSRTLTYRALDDRANRLACALLDCGLSPGDPVAVLLPNCLEFPEIATGLARAGLPMVPLDPRQTAAETEWIVRHSGARALVLDDALAGLAAGVADVAAPGGGSAGVDVVLSLRGTTAGPAYEGVLAGARAVDPHVPVGDLDIFGIQYTSGTTGNPKGVLVTHRSRVLQAYLAALEWGLGAGRASIAVAPMYHGAGFLFGFAPVLTGGTVSMLPRWDPEEMLAMTERVGAQSVFLVPTHAQTIRALGEDVLGRHDLSTLDTLYFNVAALPVALKQWVMDAFPKCGVHELYGSTEAGVVTNLRPEHAAGKWGSVGHAWYMTEVRLVGDDGLPVGPGEPGELFSRSPFLMQGYLGDPAATTACTTDDGFLTCGDIAVADDEGFLSIVDRKKDMIISGGVDIYPREIEEAVATHPAVAEAAVVGAPDETWGERIVAYVVLRPGGVLDATALDEYLRPRVASYKLPRELHLIDALPRNAAGKVLKRALQNSGQKA
ncbi:class I adenylate-forming enzyme family protein [Yinghuangia soli]|uniref:AMP-binding protein n=1 Tax=Yinghuangia soli TaxID=2908204 RepID=A0AA41Q6I2_9ACTN|nr:AMP-binding protein [Yinghuangia soli]MCF2532117.1 AMP-binding protein [Yinghuangia soli]